MKDIVVLFLAMAADENFDRQEIGHLFLSCNFELEDAVYCLVHMIICEHAKRDRLSLLEAIDRRWPGAIQKDKLVYIPTNQYDMTTIRLAIENRITRLGLKDIGEITQHLLSLYFLK
jgi:hypothetical protein